ncbi:protein TadG [Vibrio variabilis]|uniref:Protein TadG n=1 Tax=Vibrio variabilis TaxID=990271 RepID=A0ABQ0JJ85_9VIBR|nr:protein TadG [Vibrio variabilis]
MKRGLGNRYSSIKNQRGVAGIWLGMTLVPIMGFTFWAIEGTRYVQEHNRLGDANEAAAMALTIQDDTASAQNLAESYFRSYVRDIDSIAVTSVRQHQEQTDALDESIQYSVSAVTSHSSWFSSTFIPSFNETVDLHSSAVAKKYLSTLADNNIDIVFVSDFSGSMDSSWSGSSNKKIRDLQLAIKQVSAKILCENVGYKVIDGEYTEVCLDSNQDEMADKLKNRIALAPFNIRTRERDSSGNATQSASFVTDQVIGHRSHLTIMMMLIGTGGELEITGMSIIARLTDITVRTTHPQDKKKQSESMM